MYESVRVCTCVPVCVCACQLVFNNDRLLKLLLVTSFEAGVVESLAKNLSYAGNCMIELSGGGGGGGGGGGVGGGGGGGGG